MTTDAAALRAELDRLKAEAIATAEHVKFLNGEAAKYRTRNDDELKAKQAALDAEKAKLKEQGDLTKLLEIEKAEKEKLATEVAQFRIPAERYAAIEKRQIAVIDAAKAAESLPAWLISSLDRAVKSGDVDEATSILEGYRASRSPGTTIVPPAVPPTPAPAPGAAPTSPPSRKRIDDMTPAEIRAFEASDPTAYAAAIGGAPNGRDSLDPVKWMDDRSNRRG